MKTMQIFSDTHLDILHTQHVPNLHCRDIQKSSICKKKQRTEQKYSQRALGPLRPNTSQCSDLSRCELSVCRTLVPATISLRSGFIPWHFVLYSKLVDKATPPESGGLMWVKTPTLVWMNLGYWCLITFSIFSMPRALYRCKHTPAEDNIKKTLVGQRPEFNHGLLANSTGKLT